MNQEVNFLFQFLQNLEQLFSMSLFFLLFCFWFCFFSMSLSNSSGLQYFYISLSNIIYPEFKVEFFLTMIFCFPGSKKGKAFESCTWV